MEKVLTRKRIWLYLWMGLVFSTLWVIHSNFNNPGNFWPILFNNAWRILYILVVNFIFFEYTIPFIFRKRAFIIQNVLIGVLLFFLHLMLWSFGMYGWRQIGIELQIYNIVTTYINLDKALEGQMTYSASSVFFFTIIRHIYNYIKLKQATQQLRIEKQEAELNYLKSQTNPHFLFNTLNNIYSLSRDKSNLAPESILRLSKILRYMLYETSGEFVAIEQEIRIITDYIALEKLRYDDSLHVNFNYDIEDVKQALPPLLLIPLVENAFKHGASETTQRPFVDIHLSINKRQLSFVVKNSVESLPGQMVKENIGLSNLRRQLELLYTKFELTTGQNESVFTAILNINLASHV